MGGSCIHIERDEGKKRDSGFDRFPRPDVWVFLIREREEGTTFGGSLKLPFADPW